MSNLFQDVLKDAKGVEEKLLGPSYPYYKNIKLPNFRKLMSTNKKIVGYSFFIYGVEIVIYK